MNKKVIYVNKGFTLIETIISIALIGSIMTVLSFGVASSYRDYVNSNKYKSESDIDLENIQEPFTADSSTLTKYVDYSMKVEGAKGIPLAVYNTTNTNKSISLSRFEAQQSNFKDAKSFTFNIVDPYTGNLTEIEKLKNYPISSFEDMPTTNYDALDSMNKAWGKWSFVGWSLTKLKGKNNKPNVMSYTGDGRTLYCGNPNYATSATGYEGVITESNFSTIMDAIKNGTINLDDYTLVPSYFFSRDVTGRADSELLKEADPPVRQAVDHRNLNNLAQAAAQYIKKNGLDGVNSVLTSDAENAIYGNGLEILHFREDGWPQVARKYIYHLDDGGPSGGGNLSYEKSSGYLSQIKIDDGSTWKTGFIYDTFNAIGYDITKADSRNTWKGINYKYNIFMFGDSIKDNFKHLYSLFIQINQSKKTVRVFIGTVKSNWRNVTYLYSIGGYYDVTASYA